MDEYLIDSKPLNIGKFKIKQEIDYNSNQHFEDKYYNVDYLHTVAWTYLTLGEKSEEVVIIAEQFSKHFPKFLEELKQNETSTYVDMDNTETKLYGWVKDDNIRLVYQDFSSDEHEIIFDIMVEKDWFFEISEKLIKQMKKLSKQEEQRYNMYIKEKYGEKCKIR